MSGTILCTGILVMQIDAKWVPSFYSSPASTKYQVHTYYNQSCETLLGYFPDNRFLRYVLSIQNSTIGYCLANFSAIVLWFLCPDHTAHTHGHNTIYYHS